MRSDIVKRKFQNDLEKNLDHESVINKAECRMKDFDIKSKIDKISGNLKKIKTVHVDISNLIISYQKFSKNIISSDCYCAEESNISEKEKQEFKHILKQELGNTI